MEPIWKRDQGVSDAKRKETPRSVTPGRGQIGKSKSVAIGLPLRWFRRRRRRPGCRFRSRSRGSRAASLPRVRLIVEFHDILRDIYIGGGKKNRCVLRGSIQNGHIPILASVAVQHIDHFAAD